MSVMTMAIIDGDVNGYCGARAKAEKRKRNPKKKRKKQKLQKLQVCNFNSPTGPYEKKIRKIHHNIFIFYFLAGLVFLPEYRHFQCDSVRPVSFWPAPAAVGAGSQDA